ETPAGGPTKRETTCIPLPTALRPRSPPCPQTTQMPTRRPPPPPPMKTLDEPVLIWKIGARPQQVGARPRSPARAAGSPQMRTRWQRPYRITPRLGIGRGTGEGGIRLGGGRGPGAGRPHPPATVPPPPP